MTALTLVDFLRARLGEDESDHYPYQPSDDGDFTTPTSGCVHCGIPANQAGDRCRVLADVEAKRRIVAMWEDAEADAARLPHTPEAQAVEHALREALGALAATYASHPEYRSEWAP